MLGSLPFDQTPPGFDIQTISTSSAKPVITAGFGKIFALRDY
jgi:hypothetical protein